MQTCCSFYLSDIFVEGGLKQVVNTLCAEIEEWDEDFDVIAFRGMSGAMVAPAVAMELGKQFMLVRKPGKSHSDYSIEGFPKKSFSYIIIDDLIDSGKTMDIIYDDIKRASKKWNIKATLKGTFLYSSLILENDTEKFGAPLFHIVNRTVKDWKINQEAKRAVPGRMSSEEAIVTARQIEVDIETEPVNCVTSNEESGFRTGNFKFLIGE